MACSVCSRGGHNTVTCPDARRCSYCGTHGHYVSTCRTARRCSNCGSAGHNVTTCPVAHRCGWCGNVGHYVTTCPTAKRCGRCGEVGHFSQTCLGRTRRSASSIDGNVRYLLESGWPSQLETLAHRISAIARSDRVRRWKVGLSADPERRAVQYDHARSRYGEMVVIYRTTAIENARTVERWVTDKYDGDHDNQRRGGGGPEAIAVAHYVYLVLRRR